MTDRKSSILLPITLLAVVATACNSVAQQNEPVYGDDVNVKCHIRP
jgi:hypothetical protein